TEKEEEKEENEPVAKKRKIVKKGGKTRVSNGPKRKMECPECKNIRSTSMGAINSHLRKVHGISYDEFKLRNFNNIHEKKKQKKNAQEEVGVKCIMCEFQPTTTRGFSQHLIRHHDTTLCKDGIHLQCACGARINSDSGSSKHQQICKETRFAVQKNEE
ncbi:hypothetical protein PFISCL1PPCAC_21755, partial [Pristionchus fissidentatus]